MNRFVAVLALAMASSVAFGQSPIVMDNPEAQVEGEWLINSTSKDRLGSDYHYAYCVLTAPTATITYRPNLPKAGLYHVEILYPRGDNRSTNASWFIAHKGEAMTVAVNQTFEGGTWVRIASDVPFEAGTDGFVRLSNDTPDAGATRIGKTIVVADGVRFIPLDEPPASKPIEPIVIDDPQAVFSGQWPSGKEASKKFGDTYRPIPTREQTTATATYRPNIAIPGRYDVEVWYPDGENRAANAFWKISGTDGETEATVNQTVNGGRWVTIAIGKSFTAGTNGFVQLQNGTGKMGSVVVADAVRFVATTSSSRLTPQPPPPADTGPKVKGGFTLRILTEGNGNVTRTPDQQTYPAGSTVSLTAQPAEGYVFGGWTGAVSRMKNPLTLAVNGNKEITALFWPAGIGAILDNPSAEFKGSWNLSSEPYEGTRYENYHFTSSVTGKATATAIYRPTLTKAGKYDVYVWYAQGRNRAKAAPWTVHGQGGKTVKVEVDQRENGGNWFPIARNVDFETGSAGYAELSNAAEAGSVIIADAVAFVYVGQ
jgi:hypothetical protein